MSGGRVLGSLVRWIHEERGPRERRNIPQYVRKDKRWTSHKASGTWNSVTIGDVKWGGVIVVER